MAAYLIIPFIVPVAAYFSCNPLTPGPLYLHPQSALYRQVKHPRNYKCSSSLDIVLTILTIHQDVDSSLPEFVVHGDLVMNKVSGVGLND